MIRFNHIPSVLCLLYILFCLTSSASVARIARLRQTSHRQRYTSYADDPFIDHEEYYSDVGYDNYDNYQRDEMHSYYDSSEWDTKDYEEVGSFDPSYKYDDEQEQEDDSDYSARVENNSHDYQNNNIDDETNYYGEDIFEDETVKQVDYKAIESSVPQESKSRPTNRRLN